MSKKRFFQVLFLAGASFLSFGGIQTMSGLERTADVRSSAELTNSDPAMAAPYEYMPIFSKQLFADSCESGETFSNIGSSQTNYTLRTWNGDNGISWSATDARTDQNLNGRAITLRSGILKNTLAIPGGMQKLTFKYKRVFTGNSTLRVFVNGVEKSSIVVSSETEQTAVINDINTEGNILLELRNSGNRVIIDDIQWTCFGDVTPKPQLQLVDSNNTNVDCGIFTMNYGNTAVGTSQEAIFTIKNTGTAPLNVDSLSIVGADAADFTVVSPASSFVVAPQGGSNIVLVRFNNLTAGNKTALLNIHSNTDECNVFLVGTGVEPCTAPVDTPVISFVNNNALFADVQITGVTASGYLAVMAPTNLLTQTPANGTTYTAGSSFGEGTVVYNGSDANFSVSLIDYEDNPYLFVFPYNAENCTEGPAYVEFARGEEVTLACTAGLESFDAIDTTSAGTYRTRNWTGLGGISWTATDSRADQELMGTAVTLRAGSIKNNTPVSGIGTLVFNYKRVFNGSSVIKILINGSEYDAVDVDSDIAQTFATVINVPGNANNTIEIVNTSSSGGRVVIDNLSWTCYEAPTQPVALQLYDAQDNAQPCGSYTLDFGTTTEGSGNSVIKTFKIKNEGISEDLVINSITVNDTLSYEIETAGLAPIAPNGELLVTVKFVGTATLQDTVTINSNAGTCTLMVEAKVAQACSIPTAVATIEVPQNTVTQTGAVATIDAGSEVADRYLVLRSTSVITVHPQTNESYTVGDVIGSAVVVYEGNPGTFTMTDLTAGTLYHVAVFPYNNTDCSGPVYAETPADESFETPAAMDCGIVETFTNMGSSQTNYTTRTWTGDNQVSWQATQARTDQTLNGPAIALRSTGKISTVIPASQLTDGVLTFNYKRVFTGNSTVKVYINGTAMGSSINVSSETAQEASVNVMLPTGETEILLEIEVSGNRVIIDDIKWTCRAARETKSMPTDNTAVPAIVKEVNVYPNPNNGNFRIDFGNAESNAYVEIYNALGKRVFAASVASDQTIDLGNVAKGIYLIKIESGNTVTQQKMIVK